MLHTCRQLADSWAGSVFSSTRSNGGGGQNAGVVEQSAQGRQRTRTGMSQRSGINIAALDRKIDEHNRNQHATCFHGSSKNLCTTPMRWRCGSRMSKSMAKGQEHDLVHKTASVFYNTLSSSLENVDIAQELRARIVDNLLSPELL